MLTSEKLKTIINPDKKLIFVGGKGGVGKTTSASAIASRLSKSYKTLLISTDPAHSLGDCWDQVIGSSVVDIKIEGRELSVVELDAKAAFEDFKSAHEAEIRLLLDTSTNLDRDDIDQMMSLMIPGIDEVMGLRSIVDLFEKGAYEKIVVDTAPTGHALRLLFMPEILNSWIKTMASMRWKYRLVQKTFKGKYSPDQADDMLLDLKRTVSKMRSILTAHDQCEFVLVTIPNKMALQETKRLHEQLVEANVSINTLIINNLAPDSSDSFYHRKYLREQDMIKSYMTQFSELDQVGMPSLADEVVGVASIINIEETLFDQ